MENMEIARRLEEVADLLQAQRANPFRVQAYRRAATSIQRLPKTLAEIWREEGEEGLRAVVGIGERLATSLRILITTGRLPMLDRLRGETDPVALLESVPGIGQALAERLHKDLEIDSLEDLEAAAHDGRLSDIAGIGKKKLAGIVDTLAARLGRVRWRTVAAKTDEAPVEELLDVDHEYRDRGAAGELPMIAPRRFNPGGEAWLPILHTHRGERNYTALYSNTARAHELGRTRDWVVLYYDGGERAGVSPSRAIQALGERAGVSPSRAIQALGERAGVSPLRAIQALDERQCTVITSQRGKLAGKRIVRGREEECEEFYFGAKEPSSPVTGDSKLTASQPTASHPSDHL